MITVNAKDLRIGLIGFDTSLSNLVKRIWGQPTESNP